MSTEHVTLHATGAYGREAKPADWETGKDFKVIRGSYFSNRDTATLKRMGFTQVQFWVGDKPAFITDL
jgi:hypothetical protein